jgi:two-component system osmolarity sensor histidine kinase EnvZ
VQAAIATLRDVEGVERIRLSLDSGFAQADPLRFRQIIRNLTSNALRYGGPQIEIAAARLDGSWSVTVTDNGDGIPSEARDTVFESYQRSHTLKGVTGSVGIGLSVARRLAELQGGSLTYRYQNGHSIFELTVPTAEQLSAAS